MKRFAAVGFIAIAGSLTVPLAAQQRAAAPALEIRALSTRPELVSGGDVLVQIAGPANLTTKNLTVRLNGRDVSASFKPASALAPSGVEGKALVALLTGLQAGSNSVQASMRGNKTTAQTAQLAINNHPITGPVLYSRTRRRLPARRRRSASVRRSTRTARRTRRSTTSIARPRLRPAPVQTSRATSRPPTTRTASGGAARPPTIRGSRSIRTPRARPTSR